MTTEEYQELKTLIDEIKENQIKNGESLKSDFEPVNKYINRLEKEHSDLVEYQESDEYKQLQIKEKEAISEKEELLLKSYKHTEEIATSLKEMQKISEENQKNSLTDSETVMSTLSEIKNDLAKYQQERSDSDMSIMVVSLFSILLIVAFSGFLKTLFSR